jgi:membrane protease YdiL (CAAX protease family)
VPVKLTSAQYRVMGIVVAVAALSLAIGVKYFWRAFPEASIEFRVNRADSEPIARKFLEATGAHLEGYRHAAIFNYDDSAKVYLERTQGLERMNSLTRGPIRLWHWSHRWFKPLQKEEYSVSVTPAADVVVFEHEIPEAAPGASLSAEEARGIAEKFVSDVMRRDLGGLEFVETETEKRPARSDHSFTWKQKNVELGDGSYRISVEVDGDQVAGYSEFVKVPEQWSRDYQKLRSHNISAQLVDQVFLLVLVAALVIVLFRRLRDRDVHVRTAVIFGMVAAVLFFLGQLNNFGLEEFGYQTTDSYSSFMGDYFLTSILGALGWGAAILILVAGSEPVYRQDFPALFSFRRYLSWKGLRTRSFFMANVVGIGMTFFFFAYQTLFYLAANKLGAWAPSDINYSDLLNTRIPWVWVLFMGFIPAVSEEMMFRAFAIPFLRKILRSLPVALVLAAFIWGFGHAGYPNQPFYIRGLEVGVGGIIIGFIMLRYGILATLVWHYSVDALYTAFLLLRSHNTYFMVSGGVTASMMLVPLLVAALAYWRTGTFAEEDSLTNASEGVSRPPSAAAVEKAPLPLAYQPLETRRLVAAGILGAVFVALAFVHVYHFGEGLEFRATRQDALRAAEGTLREEHHVDPSTYRAVAVLRENMDPLAARYLLERRSVQETDRIYRQATRLAVWQVRFFRPLQKEEYWVFVDPQDGKSIGERHLLDENAPGPSLSPQEARALGEKTVEQQGYSLAGFELQNSQATKRKERTDYELTWQAKAGDPRNVGDAFYRMEVSIAGDQVAGFSRRFKLPEDWVRERAATGFTKILLTANSVLLAVGLFGGLLILLIKRLKAGEIPWRRSAKVGGLLAALVFLLELNSLPLVFMQYSTSISWQTFWLYIAVSYFVAPLFYGLLGWIAVALATSFYPDAWRIFNSGARRVWRRDALIAVAVMLASGAGLSRLSALYAERFHALVPVGISLFPDSVNMFLPGATVFLSALRSAFLFAALAAMIIHLVCLGLSRKAWWLWPAGVSLLVSLGPSSAHSVQQFFAGWVPSFIQVAVFLAIAIFFFRDNLLAYMAAAFLVDLADPLIDLLRESQPFYLLNGIAVAVLALGVLAWLFLGARSDTAASPQG